MDPNDPNGPELEVRLDELRASIRRSEISKAKYESRLECLRVSGAPVDEWLKEVDLLAVAEPMPRSSSLLSVRTDASGAAVSTHNNSRAKTSFYFCINVISLVGSAALFPEMYSFIFIILCCAVFFVIDFVCRWPLVRRRRVHPVACRRRRQSAELAKSLMK